MNGEQTKQVAKPNPTPKVNNAANNEHANHARQSNEAQLRFMKNSACMSYSLSGWSPSAVEWKLTEAQLIDIIRKITIGYLGRIEDVTIDINYKSGAVSAYIWLSRNSEHVVSNELNGVSTVINRPLTKLSPALKEFMNKFCAKEDHRVIKEGSGLPLVGVKVRIEVYMFVEFDDNNFNFGKEFGGEYAKKRFRISLTPNFIKGNEGKFSKLGFITVRKESKDGVSTIRPKPKRSFNA